MTQQSDRPVATRMTAPYSFGGPAEEMKRGSPLHSDETVHLARTVRCCTGWIARRPCFLRLTDRRLAFVVHYALQPDRLIEIPAGALLELTLREGWIRLRYRTDKGAESMTIWAAQAAAERNSEEDELEDGEDADLDPFPSLG